MDFDPMKIQAFMDLLVESGVEEFEGFGMHIRFTPGLFTKENEVAPVVHEDREERVVPNSLWETPELWPGGRPPKFPGKSK